MGAIVPIATFAMFLHEALQKVGLSFDILNKPCTRFLFGALTLVVCLLALSAHLLFHLHSLSKNNRRLTEEKKSTGQSNEEDFKTVLFSAILRLRGLNQVASPKNIANKINKDVGIVFAHLKKLHDEQFVTYETGGKSPTQDTDFFLSSKAVKRISLSTTKAPKRRRVIHPGIEKDI